MYVVHANTYRLRRLGLYKWNRKSSYLFQAPLLLLLHAMFDDSQESFYDSPPNVFSTKSPVLKPAPGRISWNAVAPATSMSSFDSPLQPRKCTKIFSPSHHHSSCRAAVKRSLKEIAGFGGGCRRIGRGWNRLTATQHATQEAKQSVQVPTTQLAKMSIDPKFVELTADVLEIFL